jgi:hypothetical protein
MYDTIVSGPVIGEGRRAGGNSKKVDRNVFAAKIKVFP